MLDQIPSVIITGASGGIGRAVARRFAREGFRLFLHGFRHMDFLNCLATELSETHQVPVYPIQADLSDFASIERMFTEEIFPRDSQPDVLVNNAGIACFSLLQDMTEEDWDRVMNTNVKSVFGCCRPGAALHDPAPGRLHCEYFFHVGNQRRFNGSRLFRLQGRCKRPDSRSWQRGRTVRRTGKRHCLRSD